MFLLKVTDALTNLPMLIRGDQILKIEETPQGRKITFLNDEIEFVLESIENLEQIWRVNCIHEHLI